MKLKSIILIFVLTLTTHAQWEWQYPKPQGNWLSSIACPDENNIWAVGEKGTIIHSANNGIDWEIIPPTTESYLSSIACPDPNTIVIVGYDGTILRSEDKGITWETIDFNSSFEFWQVFFRGDKGWAVGDTLNGTIAFTEDKGKTWSMLDSAPSSFWGLMAVHFVNDTCGYVCGRQRIYKTTDGGTSWNDLHIISTEEHFAIYFWDENNGITAGWGCQRSCGYIQTTTDGGLTWTRKKAMELTNSPDVFWALSNDNEGNIYLGGYQFNSIINPSGFIIKSTNRGVDWTQQYTTKLPIMWTWAMSSSPNGNMWAAAGNLILKSEDNNTRWVEMNEVPSSRLNDVYFIDKELGWVVGEMGVIMYTSDGGNNWQRGNSTTASALKSVHFINAEDGWAVGRYGTLLGTNDGGKNWTKYVLNHSADINEIDFFDSNNGIAVADSGLVFLTENGGNDWRVTKLPTENITENIIMCLGIVDSNNCIVFVFQDGLYKSTDRGNTWISTNQFTDAYIITIQFVNDKAGFMYNLNNETLLTTNDGGNSWQQIDEFTGSLVYFINNNTGWKRAMDEFDHQQIFRTTDGCNTWEKQYTPASILINNFHFIDENNGWIVGGLSSIMHTSNGGLTWMKEDSDNPISTNVHLQNNYPNPFNSSTKVVFTLNNSSHVTLSIYNIMGQVIKTINAGNLTSGTHNLTWNGTNQNNEPVSSGVYIYQLQAKDNTGNMFTKSAKMVLMK